MFTIVAILFVGPVVHVAYEVQGGEVRTFIVQNDAAGARTLSLQVRELLKAAPGKQLVCMGAAEGSSLHGAVFENTVFKEDTRRFMYAQPKYLLDARATGASPESPDTLLKLCYEVFPPIQPRKE